MTRILIHTQKGGVGKTTTALILAAALARGKKRTTVTLADLDPQQHLSAVFDAETASDALSDWLAGAEARPDPIEDEPGLSLIPGAPPEDSPASPGPVAADWTILDTAPGWSQRTASLLHWADVVLCPLEPDFLGLSGVGRLLGRMQEEGVDQDRLRILLCRFNPRLSLHREVKDRLSARFGTDLLVPVEIRTSIKLAEASGQGLSIFHHAPSSTGATDYRALANSLMRAMKRGKQAA